MANWCEGVLKIRGERKNIIAYLNDLLKPAYPEDLKFEDNGHEVSYTLAKENYFYLEGTQRAFIESNVVSFYSYQEEEDVFVVTIPKFQQAWGIRPGNYLALSLLHSVDLKLFGYERGMEFTQEVEISQGTVVKDETLNYNDWDWEVPFSDLGG